MNQFSLEIQLAKSRHRRLYVAVASSVVVLGVVLALGLGVIRGTTIDVFPEEARGDASLSLRQGIGFVLFDKAYYFSAEASISVAAPGFKTSVHLLSRQEEGSLTRVTLEPLPGKIVVRTNTAHPETRWLIDGQLISLSPEFSVEIEAGSHQLVVDSPYHEPQKTDVSLARGEVKRLNLNLNPIQGSLEIATTPLGARVKVNGEVIGKTPLVLARPGGLYQVEVSSPAHETVLDDIEISNRRPNPSRNYRLEARKGYLALSLNPDGGVLLVDGQEVPPRGRIALEATKRHRLSYHKAGYFTEVLRLRLAPGEEKSLAIELRRETGKVQIVSRPQAEVWVDSKPVGMTPVSLDLPAVTHKIKLVRQGYRSIEQRLTPSSIAAKKIDVTLKSEKQLRLEQAKAKYTNKIGMKFKMFKPDRVFMGAPRHEKGQRANEFQREVVLEKPFYVSLHEVTEAQYSQFKKGGGGPGKLPVTSVSWENAAAFCNWLSDKEGIEPFYRFSNGRYDGFNAASDGYRLPSEAEWEWLARKAGRPKQTRFPWGDDQVIPPLSGNFADETARGSVEFYIPNYNDGFAKLAPVGSYNRDKGGLFDLAGNVSEWVHDYYSLVPPRKNAVEYDPFGATDGSNRVVKGANWRSGTLTELRASFREGAVEGREDLGFRVARYLYGGANE